MTPKKRKPAKASKTAKTKKQARPARPVSRKPKGAKPMQESVTAFKAFNADMTCRGFQFEIGKTYEVKGAVQICENGFHACAVPFDCWNYYEGARTFAQVQMQDPIGKSDDSDSKLVTGRITIEASLNLPAWVRKQVETVIDLCRTSKGSLTAGNYAHAASTGDGAHAASTGNYAHAASTGDGAHAASTGDGAHAASTGNYAHAASTGNYAHAASTGYRAHAASTGDGAHAASTGNYAHAKAIGPNSVAVSAGLNGRAAAGENGAVAVSWWDGTRHRVTVGYAGENGIQARRWYKADENGKLVDDGAAE